MQDQPVVLVLNAGSSSLKFCVYSATGQELWQALARGQVEGIGSHPRFSATDAGGRPGRDFAPERAAEHISCGVGDPYHGEQQQEQRWSALQLREREPGWHQYDNCANAELVLFFSPTTSVLHNVKNGTLANSVFFVSEGAVWIRADGLARRIPMMQSADVAACGK